MSIHNNYVAILAGGVGSRFWPESRNSKPKQFLDLLNTGRSLLQATYDRFLAFIPKEQIYVITHRSHLDLVLDQVPGISYDNILCEPSRKNTVPSVTYLAYRLNKVNPNANIIVSPSDHLVLDERAFERTIHEAFDFINRNNALLTVGIPPNRPETAYGYIQFEESENNYTEKIHKVKTFTEKPNLELARTFLKSGDFLWNSGMFGWNLNTFFKAIHECVPEIDEVFKQADAVANRVDYPHIIDQVYAQCTNVSIEFGLMERYKNVYTLKAHFGWSDLGNWASIYDNSEKDYLANAVYGDNVLIVDAAECMIKAPKDKMVVIQGLENFIVIDTKDILLICDRAKEKKIKDYIGEIKRNKGEKFL